MPYYFVRLWYYLLAEVCRYESIPTPELMEEYVLKEYPNFVKDWQPDGKSRWAMREFNLNREDCFRWKLKQVYSSCLREAWTVAKLYELSDKINLYRHHEYDIYNRIDVYICIESNCYGVGISHKATDEQGAENELRKTESAAKHISPMPADKYVAETAFVKGRRDALHVLSDQDMRTILEQVLIFS